MTAKKIKQLEIIFSIAALLLVGLGLFIHGQTAGKQTIIQLRLPRVIFALFGGSMLTVSALLFQTTLRSDYIDGSMLGLASGAELVIALVNLLFYQLLSYRVLIGALTGGLLLVILRTTLFKIKRSSFFLILGGLSLALLFVAATQLITTGSGFQGKSLSNTTWTDLWFLVIILLSGLLLLLWQWEQFKGFVLPSLQAQQLGFNEQKSSLVFQLVAGMWLGAVSAVLGTVFFVGIVLVQVVKLSTKVVAGQRIFLTILTGGCVLVCADDLAHYLIPSQELPTNALLMLLTAPLILFLIMRWSREV